MEVSDFEVSCNSEADRFPFRSVSSSELRSQTF